MCVWLQFVCDLSNCAQGFKSYAVRTVIAGWFVYTPHRANTSAADSSQGRDLQFNHWIKRFREVEHSGRNMFRPRHNEHEHRPRSEPPGALCRADALQALTVVYRTSYTSAGKLGLRKRVLPSLSTIATRKRAPSASRIALKSPS